MSIVSDAPPYRERTVRRMTRYGKLEYVEHPEPGLAEDITVCGEEFMRKDQAIEVLESAGLTHDRAVYHLNRAALSGRVRVAAIHAKAWLYHADDMNIEYAHQRSRLDRKAARAAERDS